MRVGFGQVQRQKSKVSCVCMPDWGPDGWSIGGGDGEIDEISSQDFQSSGFGCPDKDPIC